MRIGENIDKELQVDDIVLLRMELSAGMGRVAHTQKSKELDKDIYWCEFPSRSDGYFEEADLHCDRLHGKDIRGPQIDEETIF